MPLAIPLAVVTLIVLTIPLTYFETPKSRPLSIASVIALLQHCFPVFFALFAYSLIDNMPKFVMEGMLDYSNQLYYNALYFPYVLDLKPYAIRPLPAPADPILQQARDWFQTYVPERTLYNWQTAAAKLIAQQLRERVGTAAVN